MPGWPAARRPINSLAGFIKWLRRQHAISRRVAIELPPPDTKRWTARRKAAVVEAVRIGMISVQEACLRYGLTIEEFLSWQRTIEQHGIPGLRATRVGIYRDKGLGKDGQR